MFMHDWKKWEINTIEFDDLPEQLKRIQNCPKKLFYRGKWRKEIFDNTLVVVGSRRMTRYGKEIVNKFMPDLVINKMTIISGFMYGIDTEAHRTCIELGGTTVAVLGSGLNYLPTIENDGLYIRILESGGVVISEYEPELKATTWTFPQRNRIVAGLATKGVLVVEAGMKSGSLITAKYANRQGKTVFAIPGPLTSATCEGTNWLIKSNSATMATEVGDLLAEKALMSEQYNLFEDVSDARERNIIEWLKREQATIDELARGLEMTISETSVLISGMLMKNLVNEEAGEIFLNRL
jgi:DNA processing protein